MEHPGDRSKGSEKILLKGSSSEAPSPPFGAEQPAAASSSVQPRASSVHAFSDALLLLARILLVVIVASTVQALFPANPLAPGWYLRVAKMLVDYSPAFLLALSLALLSRFTSSSSRQSALARTLARRLLSIGLAVYAVFSAAADRQLRLALVRYC